MPERRLYPMIRALDPDEQAGAPKAEESAAEPRDPAEPAGNQAAAEDGTAAPGTHVDRKLVRAQKRRARAERRKEQRAQWRRAKDARRQEREMSRLRRRGLVEGEASAADADEGVLAPADRS